MGRLSAPPAAPDLGAAIAAALLVFQCALMGLGYQWRETDVAALNDELGAVEIGSGIAYLVAGIAAATIARTASGSRRWIFVGWTLLCIAFFGEETSWLQHYLGFPTPAAIERINAQGEFNLHNIATEGGSITDALAGGNLDWRILAKSQNLFNGGFLLYFLVLPLVYRFSSTFRDWARAWSVPTVGPRFVVCFWVPIVLSVIVGFADVANSTSLRAHVGETRELIYAIAIAAFLILHARDAREPERPAWMSASRGR